MPLESGDGIPPTVRWERGETRAIVRDRLERNRDDPDALFVLAALHTQNGDVDQGLSVLDRVLGIDPSYPGAWFFKEKLHRMRGESEAAAEARERAEAAEP